MASTSRIIDGKLNNGGVQYLKGSEASGSLEIVDRQKLVMLLNTDVFTQSCVSTPDNFMMCLHDAGKDYSARSRSSIKRGQYERSVTLLIKSAMKLYPKACVIDAGGNIGYYSLLAAALGHQAVAVEPAKQNVRLFAMSVLLNNFGDRITLLRNALSDEHTFVEMSTDAANQGALQVLDKSPANASIRTITFDDLVPILRTKIAIIKIDIEGYECKALKASSGLFRSAYVPYVFMEWYFRFHKRKSCQAADVKAMTQMFVSRGYVPYRSGPDSHRLDANASSVWNVKDIYWRHESAPLLP